MSRLVSASIPSWETGQGKARAERPPPKVVPLTQMNLWALPAFSNGNKPFSLVDRIKSWQGGKYGTIAAERCFRMHSIRGTGLDKGLPDAVRGNQQLCRG
eukprot:TRINITY_DN9584_c0_g1_i1.p1 TRINITY_DN9584_c0_g1~~TRINITY_DN9584_c0_g1_i1.p1  ORF type:complete len:100 (-),score=4.04 TRINITY_DN9584_c0_g1_i1:305-604(-)